MKTYPTITEIQAQIISDIESKTGQSVPLLSKAVFRVISYALAGAVYLLYRFGAWAYYQIFTVYADREGLIAKGAEYGITLNPAQGWEGTATATGTDGTVIAVGTLYSYNSNVYRVTEEETIASSTATISLQSLETGDAVNLDDSTVINLVSPQTGLDSTATVTATTQTAEDEEDIEDFRTRILNRQQNLPQGGAIADYVQWALEVSGISEAYAFSPDPGFVNIYPLTDDDDPANRVPDAPKLAEVEAYVGSDLRKPLGAQIAALAFDELDFDVDIANLSPDSAAIRAAIETAIESYMYERRPQQYEDEVNLKHKVSAGEITKIAIDAGAQVATITLKNAGGSPITSYTLEDDELAVLRALTWL